MVYKIEPENMSEDGVEEVIRNTNDEDTVIVYPRQGANEDIPCIPLGFLSAKWGCRVVDMNTEKPQDLWMGEPSRNLIAVHIHSIP